MYAKGDTKTKLVSNRILLKKKDIQKTDYPIRVTISTIDKDKLKQSLQRFLYSKKTKYNYRSVALIRLLFYCRQQRGKRFRNFLLNCRSSRALPTITRTLAKAEFITKASITSIAAAASILRDIYNEFARLRYDIINTKTPIDRVLKELANKEFFAIPEADKDRRLRCLFFAYPKYIEIYKQNAYALIYDYTYKIYVSSLPVLCFDFIIGLSKVLPLAYIIMPDETFNSYEQAFIQLLRLFVDYEIDNLDIIIYDRDRAAINAIRRVFLGVKTILYTQYIDIAVKANVYKIFGQQKDKETNRYVPSKLAYEFLNLYRKCRLVLTELVFEQVYTNLSIRAKYSRSDESDESDYDEARIKRELAEELDKIVQPTDRRKTVTTIDKNIPTRQLKAERYLQTTQQPYKELCIRVQTDKLLYYGFDVLSLGKGIYRGLKKQTASARNDILTIIIKIILYYDSYLNCYKHSLAYTQNSSSS